MTSTYSDLYGPQDPSVLTSQLTYRSELLMRGEINEDQTLQVNQLTSNIFWTFRMDDQTRVRLHPRVLDRLYDMGFYHVARCGAMVIDCHLITALVERWRPETHTFHFPIGEATVTLQDVAIIWGLHINGRPLSIDEHTFDADEWRWYCFEFLGFTPEDADFKSKTRIRLSAISSHLLETEIDDDTDEDIVDQYARGCVLLMLGSYMMPDSSRSHVSLLYLQAIENIADAGTYSWGSAVLAYLYRQLCNAADSDKTSIGGAVSLLQVWAWSRIPAIQPTNRGDRLLQMPLEGFTGRNLGLPPYGSRWNTNHSFRRTTRFSIRVYRDIFDRMDDGDFHWVVYDMESPEIAALDDRCRTIFWMSECPLIMMAIVELHHPDRVLRQFGCVQGVPPALNYAHTETHLISFHGRSGCNWRAYHQGWIGYWDIRLPVNNAIPIHNNQSLTGGYMGWYRSITRLIISPRRYASNLGYQSSNIAARDEVFHMLGRLNIAANEVTTSSTPSVEALKNASYDVVHNAGRLLARQPLNYEPYTAPSIAGHCEAGPSTAGQYHYTAGPSTQEHYQGWQSNAEGSTSRQRGRGFNIASRDATHLDVPNLNSGYMHQTDTPSAYIPQLETPPVFMQGMYTQPHNDFTTLLQADHSTGGYGYGGHEHTGFGGPPQYNRSPVPFTGYTSPTFLAPMDVVEDQNEQEEHGGDDGRRRSRRERRARACGTTSHLRMQ